MQMLALLGDGEGFGIHSERAGKGFKHSKQRTDIPAGQLTRQLQLLWEQITRGKLGAGGQLGSCPGVYVWGGVLWGPGQGESVQLPNRGPDWAVHP